MFVATFWIFKKHDLSVVQHLKFQINLVLIKEIIFKLVATMSMGGRGVLIHNGWNSTLDDSDWFNLSLRILIPFKDPDQ